MIMDKSTIEKLIAETVAESCRVKALVAEKMSEDIAHAASLIADSLEAGGKLLVCGNGGSAADSQHMAAELVGRYLKNRHAYAAVALTTDTSILTAVANDFGFNEVFERQVRGLGRKGDVLLGISTSGNSPDVFKAVAAAREIGMKTIALTGQGGGKLAKISDVLLAVPSDFTPRIQESHSMIIHLLCEIIENTLSRADG